MRVDYSKLTTIAADKNARKRFARDSSVSLYNFTMALGNTLEISSSWNEAEMAMITASLNRWVLHKDDVSKKEYPVGSIVLIELGMNFAPELSYNHAALVLEDLDDMVLIIPATSTEKVFERAYHPKDNPKGKWYYRRVSPNDGFAKDCSLILSNLKVVAKSSIIKSIGCLSEDINKNDSLFREVRSTILSHTFSKEYVDYRKLKDDNYTMILKIRQLEEQIIKLSEENKLLSELLDNT